MNKRSHKIIWGIALTIAVMALGLNSFLASMETREVQAARQQALAQRDDAIADMKVLLATDWRLRRAPTRQRVEQVARYATIPKMDTAETYFAQGLFRFHAQSDTPGAEVALRRAVELQPEWAWAHDVLGVVLFKEGKHEAGQASIEQAMTLAPDWSRPYSDLARLYRLAEDWDKALEYAQKAIAMDEDNPVTHYNYGVVLDYMGDREGAQKIYREVLELDAELPAPYYNMACGYGRDGDVEEALKYLAIAIRLSPEFHAESQEDPDFDTIRDDPRFVAFLEQHQP